MRNLPLPFLAYLLCNKDFASVGSTIDSWTSSWEYAKFCDDEEEDDDDPSRPKATLAEKWNITPPLISFDDLTFTMT